MSHAFLLVKARSGSQDNQLPTFDATASLSGHLPMERPNHRDVEIDQDRTRAHGVRQRAFRSSLRLRDHELGEELGSSGHLHLIGFTPRGGGPKHAGIISQDVEVRCLDAA